jgi:hypothetical protein
MIKEKKFVLLFFFVFYNWSYCRILVLRPSKGARGVRGALVRVINQRVSFINALSYNSALSPFSARPIKVGSGIMVLERGGALSYTREQGSLSLEVQRGEDDMARHRKSGPAVYD